MSKRPRTNTDTGTWHTVATMPYDKAHPEKVIAGVYPGAQVPDYIRQFALGVHVDIGISQHTVEAATWIICWVERAIQNNDFNVLALYRVLYSLTKGHCEVTARTRGHVVVGPHLCWDEKQNILDTAKVVFGCLEEYRVKYSVPTVCIPKKTPVVNDPFWLMFSSLCTHVAVAMDRVQMMTVEHKTAVYCYKKMNAIDVQYVVYRLTQPPKPVCVKSDADATRLRIGTEVAYLTEALAQQPQLADKTFISKYLNQIALGIQEFPKELAGLNKLVVEWMPKLKTLSTRRTSDDQDCEQFFKGFERLQVKMVQKTPKSKQMLYDTKWLFVHRWDCSNPKALWEAQRGALPLKLKDMKYFDEHWDDADEAGRAEWFKVSVGMAGFELLCPPIIYIKDHSVKNAMRDTGKKWEFECMVYNRTADKVHTMTLPLDVVRRGALPKLETYWRSKGFANVPESEVYSAALHGEYVFGKDAMEYSVPE
jgi:hypothetical protein